MRKKNLQNKSWSLFLILMGSSLLIACNDNSEKPDETTVGEEVIEKKLYLNDTGLVGYTQTFTERATTDPLSEPLITTPDATAPNQDADLGKDRETGVTDLDGNNGFTFTRLDENGNTYTTQPESYAATPWSCVKDETTGLIWEVKTISGLQAGYNTYTWYNSDSLSNGGDAGTLNEDVTCFTTLDNCNTEAYINAINNLNSGAGLCGLNEWRLPLREELRSILDYGVTSGPMIDINYFPNAKDGDTWTSQTAFYSTTTGDQAWEIHFDNGRSEAHDKASTDVYVRLVHDPVN